MAVRPRSEGWLKLEEVLAAFQRSVSEAETRMSLAGRELRSDLAFSISDLRISLPVETELRGGAVFARPAPLDIRAGEGASDARLTRLDFTLKAVPVLREPERHAEPSKPAKPRR